MSGIVMIILDEDELKTIGEVKQNTLIRGDCLNVMPYIADGSIDAIITDLPYGTTACKWDSVIPFEPMWQQVKRVLKPKGAFVTTASQPFTSMLIMSNLKWFKYEWIWRKTKPSGHLNAKKQPMRSTENIPVFYQSQCTYNLQGLIYGEFNNDRPSRATKIKGDYVYGQERRIGISNFTNYPNNILEFPNPNNEQFHNTQKPVALYEYLIRTYTNPGDTVLDIAMGSGTTIVAAIQTGRNAIGIEKESKYFEIAQRRAQETQLPLPFDGG